MTEKYGKDYLIREIAARANFTVSDVKIIWATFEEIVKEIIQEKSELIVGGLFKISVGEIREHEGVNAYKNIRQHIAKSYRIKFRASRSLLQLLK